MRLYQDDIKAIAIVVFFVLFFGVVIWGCRAQFREQQECNERGGVYIKQAIGYTCVSPYRPEVR